MNLFNAINFNAVAQAGQRRDDQPGHAGLPGSERDVRPGRPGDAARLPVQLLARLRHRHAVRLAGHANPASRAASDGNLTTGAVSGIKTARRGFTRREDYAARHRNARSIAHSAELGLPLRSRRRDDRSRPRPRRPPPAARERASGHRRHSRVFQPSALRPLHGLRAAGASALGPGRGSDSRPRGVRADADRAHDGAADRRGRRLRARHPRPHRASEQHRRVPGARRHAAAPAAGPARAGGPRRRRRARHRTGR